MTFELTVVNNTPMTPIADLDEVAIAFLRQVGYLGRGAEDEENARESLAYRLFRDAFLMRPDKPWTVEELITTLETSRPTIYRHLNKLKALDLLEEGSVRGESDINGRKTYRIRYGNLAKAWNFVEANVKVAMENYRKTVDHLHALSESRARAAPPVGKEVRA
jgi:predicted transcriptional regulator